MKQSLCYGAAALLLLSAPALAQNTKTLEPNVLTEQVKRPPLQLSEQQAAAIQQALASENTEQKSPADYAPKVGDTVPAKLTVDAIPEAAVRRDPSLQPFGYAKLAKDVLVIDPMKKTIVAILPRAQPDTAKAATPADWAKTKGRELTGQAPEPATKATTSPEPAGDSGDKPNGNESGATKQ